MIYSYLHISSATDELGKGMDFYKHLGVDSSATLNQLNKAYRKKSLELQYAQLLHTARRADV